MFSRDRFVLLDSEPLTVFNVDEGPRAVSIIFGHGPHSVEVILEYKHVMELVFKLVLWLTSSPRTDTSEVGGDYDLRDHEGHGS